jgi:hypothetical protein
MTKFLFASPSFLSGAARTLDLGAQFDSYNASLSTQQADMLAMFADWYTVGEDIRDALNEYEIEEPNKCLSLNP